MKEEDIDKRIERVVESVGSKKAAMRQWESDRIVSEKQRSVAKERWRVYGISAAASVVVICGVAIGLLTNRGGVESGNNVVDGSEEYSVSSATPSYRGGSSDISEIQAMIESAQYDTALQAIDATMADTIIDSTYPKERQEYLRSLNANREYELTWLKIDILVKTKKNGDAIALLEEYAEIEGDHEDEAKELINRLKK